jgi:hypothetical protein
LNSKRRRDRQPRAGKAAPPPSVLLNPGVTELAPERRRIG